MFAPAGGGIGRVALASQALWYNRARQPGQRPWRQAVQILLIEDDELLGDAVSAGLSQENYAVVWVRDGLAAERVLGRGHFDAVVLDLGLPQRPGLDVLKTLRAQGDTTPVLILTARDTLADRVMGLDHGADDYLIKPFDLDELYARLRALTRRSAGRATPLLRHGDIALDPAGHRVTRAGGLVELTAREFVILKMLMENAGRVLSRVRLEEGLYGWETDVESNAVEVHVHRLRKKLGGDLIRTVRGVGYTIDKEDR